jgi:hypothetical protein
MPFLADNNEEFPNLKRKLILSVREIKNKNIVRTIATASIGLQSLFGAQAGFDQGREIGGLVIAGDDAAKRTHRATCLEARAGSQIT